MDNSNTVRIRNRKGKKDLLLYVEGDIVKNCQETILLHQCNCVTNHASGLARQIFQAFPYSNVYQTRTGYSKPGSISIEGNIDKDRLIGNLFAQYYPGKPHPKTDTAEMRLKWFDMCLKHVGEFLKHLPTKISRSVAVPYGIGCGLAGGDWKRYEKKLRIFSEIYHIMVVIYHPLMCTT